MNFDKLVEIIEQTNNSLQKKVLSATNQALVIRNWLVGFYIVEFEQNGEDHAQYGKKLFSTIAKSLKKKKLKGFSETNLRLFRQFYQAYPQFYELFAKETGLNIGIGGISGYFQIHQPLADKLTVSIKKENNLNSISYSQKLLQNLSFSHFTYLIQVEDPIKRSFYEQECIKGNWSKRTLERQIESLLAERLLMSKDKEKMLELVQKN